MTRLEKAMHMGQTDERFLMGQRPTMACGHTADAANPYTGHPVHAACLDAGNPDGGLLAERANPDPDLGQGSS